MQHDRTTRVWRVRLTAASLLLAAFGACAAIGAPRDQLLANVAMDLPDYIRDVDAATLNRSQLAAIYSIMHAHGNRSFKVRQIKSVLGGGYSLRDLLFR